MSIIRVALYTLVRRELTRIFLIWTQTLLPAVITTSLYFLIFGTFMGNRIGNIEGVNYLQFIVPGLVMMSVITNSYSNTVSSVFLNKFQRSLEEMLVSPMPNWVILGGFCLGGVMRGLIVGILVLGVSLFFAPLHISHPGIVLGSIFLSACFFSLCGFVNALFARNFDDIAIVPTFVLTPLTYLGGVFYSISFLPPVWQKISYLNPIFYLVNIFRYGALGISDIPIYAALAILVTLTLSVWVICLYLLRIGKGIRT